MTTIHAQLIGEMALLSRSDLDRLIELARRSNSVDLHMVEDELPTRSLMRLAEQSGAFDFLLDEGEDIYTLESGEPIECRP